MSAKPEKKAVSNNFNHYSRFNLKTSNGRENVCGRKSGKGNQQFAKPRFRMDEVSGHCNGNLWCNDGADYCWYYHCMVANLAWNYSISGCKKLKVSYTHWRQIHVDEIASKHQ